jgi:hypothetical protein
MTLVRPFLSEVWRELRGDPDAESLVSLTDSGRFGAVFPVTDLASASIAAAGLAVSDFIGLNGPAPAVHADSR